MWIRGAKTANFSKFLFQPPPGSNISSVNGCLLNGSVLLFNRCRMITDRSMIWPLGNTTGSIIRVSMSGSLNSSGASAIQSSDFWLSIRISWAFVPNALNLSISSDVFIHERSRRRIASSKSSFLNERYEKNFQSMDEIKESKK